MKPILWMMAGVLPLCSQTASVTGPVLGVIFEAGTGRIRPLAGIPASATLGAPYDAGVTLKIAVPAAGEDYAIGADVDSGASVLVSASGRVELPGVESGAVRMAISPQGRTAAFYFAPSASVQIVTGLPGHPRVSREVNLGGPPPSALAVSDDGEFLLAATAQDSGEAILLDQAGQGSRVLQGASHVVAMEFVPGSHDAVFAETAANAVWLTSGTQVTALANERDGIADVAGVAASSDGSTIFIAMRSGQIAIRKATNSDLAVVDCSCEPSGLFRLRGRAVFRLNGIGEGPVWLLDASGEEPQVLFVAAPARGDQ